MAVLLVNDGQAVEGSIVPSRKELILDLIDFDTARTSIAISLLDAAMAQSVSGGGKPVPFVTHGFNPYDTQTVPQETNATIIKEKGKYMVLDSRRQARRRDHLTAFIDPYTSLSGCICKAADQVDQFLVNTLPPRLKQMPRGRPCMALVLYGSTAIAFAALFYSAYQQNKGVKYMTIKADNDIMPAGCDEVAKDISQSFVLDTEYVSCLVDAVNSIH